MTSAFENIRLLWAGEWPLWQTVAFAIALVLLAVWIYRGEAKRGTRGKLRWLLPALRCLALVAIVLTLAGPVLQLQREEGNRGKITVFLDSSESMDLKDKNYSPGRKVLLAKEHGFLPEELNLVDYRFATASREMENLAELLRKADNEGLENDKLNSIRKQLSAVLKLLREPRKELSEATQKILCLKKYGSVWKGATGKICSIKEALFQRNPTKVHTCQKQNPIETSATDTLGKSVLT